MDRGTGCQHGRPGSRRTGGVAAAATQEAEPNDDFGTAQEITGGNVTGEIVDGESDVYRIEANTTDALDVRLSPASAELEFRIYGPDRTEIAADGFVDEGATDRLTIEAQETGTYYVEVTGADRQTTTEYRLQSNRTGSTVDPDPDPGPRPVTGTDRPVETDGDGPYRDVNGEGTSTSSTSQPCCRTSTARRSGTTPERSTSAATAE